MSAVITLGSMLLGIAVTAAPGVSVLGITKIVEKFCEGKEEAAEPVLTRFSDRNMLEKTLHECGYQTENTEDGALIMCSAGGKVKFYKEEGMDVFSAIPVELHDSEELCGELEDLNEEYMANVQTHTYRLLKENLSKRMDISLESEQVLEDDTILLTLTVD